FISSELLFFARCFLLDITVPVAPETHQLRVRDLDDAADKLIQKFAIVRDHDNRAWITSQIFLEPLKRFEIEMIRRFVEQKEVGFHHEQAREMRAHDPATAQGARRAIEISFAKSESGEDPFCFWFELPPAVLVKNMDS